jgi:hypothetical protein
MQVAVDREARSAFMILAVCTFTLVFAAITFIVSGGAQRVSAEIPSSWAMSGMAGR